MNAIEQAREVSKRLHLGASIANDRNIDKDFATLAKAAGNTIDALIAELAALKGQEPVGHLDGLDECADFMSIKLRQGHEAHKTQNYKSSFKRPKIHATGTSGAATSYKRAKAPCATLNALWSATSLQTGHC